MSKLVIMNKMRNLIDVYIFSLLLKNKLNFDDLELVGDDCKLRDETETEKTNGSFGRSR